MTAEEELKLVNRAAGGDEGAFEKLVIENERLIYNVALKITGNPDDAEDVAQEAFIKAYRNLGSFRGESRFSGWLYRLCYNAAMDHIRKNRDPNLRSLTNDDGSDAELDVADPAPTPEESADRKETQRIVREAVAMLDDDKREILIMREFSGMSYTAIADALGIEEGTVKSRISRARASLAEILRQSGTFSQLAESNSRKGGKRNV
ncbi:MAG: sigma-70 family RNA polymerase sigma factor [Oscillospiraceae bacterium]|nr:sigma-70 family RNA polymerase sigma factor [Oscillospiraceae bacterium]